MANIVVTGAARGIALELVKQHAAKGDTVFAMPRDPGAADALGKVPAILAEMCKSSAWMWVTTHR